MAVNKINPLILVPVMVIALQQFSKVEALRTQVFLHLLFTFYLSQNETQNQNHTLPSVQIASIKETETSRG